jgi:DNA repair protein RecO (recombination protein O)
LLRVSRALLLRSVPQRESDLLMTFFGEHVGVIALSMRGARASKKRAGGALEPFHTVVIRYEARGEIGQLREAEVATVRLHLTASLESLNAAGALTRWLRHALPREAPEPSLFALTEHALDALNTGAAPEIELVRFGSHLLEHMGYAFNLAQCSVCGRARPPGKAASLDPTRGGIVCTDCGGALAPGTLIQGSALDESGANLSLASARVLLPHVERALSHHTGMRIQ